VGQKQPTISMLFLLAEALELPFASFAERIDTRYRKSSRAAQRRRHSTPSG